ncbi:cell division protein FtsQ/DivIB [Burkholderiales bacterium]|nr:cell division protein FtsQ/DivIB [Burkholderiales bacterium]
MVNRINFVGDIKHVSRDQFNSVVTKSFKGGFFNLNLREAKVSLEQLSWIKNVEIKRNWPNAIDVLVSERNVVARWESGGLLDISGQIFNGAVDKRLPILSGPIGHNETVVAQYLKLTELLKPYGVTLDRLRLTKQQSWSGRLSNGTAVALGKRNIASRIERFMRFLPGSQARHKSSVEFADLRYANGFSVGPSVNGKDGF